MDPGTRKWNARYRDAAQAPPARVLLENIHLLPAHGSALDLACGLGSHAFLLASHGLEAWAWDSSSEAIERVRARAKALGLPVHAELRDVVARPPPPDRFDVIVVVRFLDRSLSRCLVDALRSGGMLFYQTFTQTHAGDSGPGNPEYRLRDNELLSMFPGLRVLVYREEGRLATPASGLRDQAMLVATKL